MHCIHCGAPLTGQYCQKCGKPAGANAPQRKSKLAAGLLGIFVGGLGVHNFYLGYTSRAIAQLVLTLLSCGIGSLWGFIEGILILVGTIDRDAEGFPLGD